MKVRSRRRLLKYDLGDLVTAEDYDWADFRAAQGRRKPKTGPGITSGPRLRKIIVVRESSTYAKKLFQAALMQAWDRNANVSSMDIVREAGQKPLYEPDDCPFEVLTIKGKAFHAAFFIVGDVGFIYSPASAKLSNKRGDNEFTATLVALIMRHRPIILDAVAFTRLVRSLDHGPELGLACGKYVDVVLAGDAKLDFKGNPAWSQFMWVFLSAMSSAGRDEIERQKVGGVLVKYKRGEWLIEKDDVPFGYTYSNNKTLVPDPSKRAAVASMIRILISDLPQATKITMLMDLGVLKQRPANATSALRTRIRWIPFYCNGVWIQRYRNPFPGVDELMGVPVIRSGKHDDGHFQLVYKSALPPGGWIDHSLKVAGLALLRSLQEPRTGGKRSHVGLAGYQWAAPIGSRRGKREWRIMPGDLLHVRVRRGGRS